MFRKTDYLADFHAEISPLFAYCEIEDEGVNPAITRADIGSEFRDSSFPHELLTRFADKGDTEALQAAYRLKESGIYVRVINMHTIKPIDRKTVIRSARETGAIVTAEEHQVTGGFGSAVAEVLAREYPVPMNFIGMPDRFGESGNPRELMEKFGMTAHSIEEAVLSLLQAL